MANWAVDPRPHVPRGFTLQDPVSRPPLRHEVYVAGCYSLHDEDLAIVKLQPPVHKDDFASLDSALRAFFEEMHRVRVAEIQPCPLGDAYVRFNTALEREKFLGPVFSFGNCSMTVIKHDEGDNVRSYDLDREAWVMLVGFPEDLKNGPIIAKAVSGFGILVYWHESNNLARVVAKVYLNDNAKIPDSVKINAGLPQKGRSWTLPCYVLKTNSVFAPRDEEGFATVDGAGHSRWEEQLAPMDPVPETTEV
ncbi:uncharacterized protein [Miscanthus floridulus]|uniref:uncharacterized protein isoform X2 n=1 Tax=Miscanthus floridulus TaxID=154761 RepID=UPI003459F596